MKKTKYIFFVFSMLIIVSCNKSLTEVPLDFYSPENSYTNKGQFESALAGIYSNVRSNFYAMQTRWPILICLVLIAILLTTGYQVTGTRHTFNWNTLNADKLPAVVFSANGGPGYIG
jgi:hypothetical protein